MSETKPKLTDVEWDTHFNDFKNPKNDGAFLRLPKALLAFLGDYQEAVILAFLVDQQRFFARSADLQAKGGWFFCTRENIQANTGACISIVSRVTNKLESQGILESKYDGIGKRKFYRINMLQYALCLRSGEAKLENKNEVREVKKRLKKQVNAQ